MNTIIDMPLSAKINLLARIYARRLGEIMQTCLCPHCRKAIVLRIEKKSSSQSWAVAQGATFEQTVPWETDLNQGPVEATRSTPARAATLESDVFVPLLQSLATGVAIAIPSIGLTIWLRWEWYAPVMIGGVTATVTWLQLLGAHRKLLWIVETVSSLVDHGHAPEPAQPKAQKISLEVKHEEAGRMNRMQFLDLPAGVTQDQFTDWALAVSGGIKTPARSNWVGSGKPFSRDKYGIFISAMVEAGILRPIPGKGNRLTSEGRQTLKSLTEG